MKLRLDLPTVAALAGITAYAVFASSLAIAQGVSLLVLPLIVASAIVGAIIALAIAPPLARWLKERLDTRDLP
jgi:hypothetical protein